MSIEANKATVRRFVEEILNKGDLDVMDEIVATDYVRHMPGGQDIHGLEGLKAQVEQAKEEWSDLTFIAEDMVAEGDRVAVRFLSQPTHSRTAFGIPPTGKQLTYTSMVIYRIADGKIVEDWVEHDFLGLLQQMGAIPPLGEG
jgi:predicted ester cyclase